MIELAHFIFALALAYLLNKRLVTASIFALVPDFDLLLDSLYPFTYQGVMHSVLAGAVFASLVYAYSDNRNSAESCFLGYTSHLFLDLVTYSGIPLFFPLGTRFSVPMFSAYSLEANLAVVSLAVISIAVKKNWSLFRPMMPGALRKLERRIRRR